MILREGLSLNLVTISSSALIELVLKSFVNAVNWGDIRLSL